MSLKISIEKCGMQEAIEPSSYIDSDHPDIQGFAEQHASATDEPRTRAISLYLAVRDQVLYDPYSIRLDPEALRASAILQSGRGFCVAKAVLYAAVLRAAGVPARIGFADVRNHLTTPRLRQLMGTDVFYYHGYTEVGLDGHWLKATPAFNLSLCEKFGIQPLEFDGREDSVFHPYDRAGRQHMEYVKDHGPRPDLPFDELMTAYRHHYPVLFQGNAQDLKGDFAAEAEASGV